MNKERWDTFCESDLNVFPSIEDYKSKLNELDSYDFSGLTPLQIYNKFYDLALIFPSDLAYFNPEKFNSFPFYRVRLNIDKKLEDLSLAQTYSYPPTNVSKENGRANLKNRSVFYCSNDAYAAIIETKPKIGDYGYLSVWTGKAERTIKSAMLLPIDLNPEHKWYLMSQNISSYRQGKLKNKAEKVSEHYMALYECISKRFKNEKAPYPLTSMLSYELLMGDQFWNDFIIYPSVASNSKYCNMAFHPNSVDENLRLNRVYRFKVVDVVNGHPKIEFENKYRKIKYTKMIERDLSPEERESLDQSCSS